MTTLKARDLEESQRSEENLQRKFESFVRCWAPMHSEHQFHADLHMLIRAVHQDAAKPYEKAMSQMMSAMPIIVQKNGDL